MLEQLRKQQGSVLHPNYGAPFHSFEDTLHRLLPYHLYQGTANSSEDYQRGSKLCNLFLHPKHRQFSEFLCHHELFFSLVHSG